MDLNPYVVGDDVSDNGGKRNDLSQVLEIEGEERLQRKEGQTGHCGINKVEVLFDERRI